MSDYKFPKPFSYSTNPVLKLSNPAQVEEEEEKV
jgi:hypothetical protein